MSDAIAEEKRALRAELRERRQMMSETARDAASAGLADQLDILVARFTVRSVSCFLSTTTEPNTRPFITRAMERGIRVLLPITRADGLLDWAVAEPDGDETEGLFGMPEPLGELLGPIAVGDCELMIVPAAAVDASGMRLGWGRGYFDKTLGSMERRPPVYAVIFDDELLPAVPREVHDQPVTGVVTPTRIVELSPTRS